MWVQIQIQGLIKGLKTQRNRFRLDVIVLGLGYPRMVEGFLGAESPMRVDMQEVADKVEEEDVIAAESRFQA